MEFCETPKTNGFLLLRLNYVVWVPWISAQESQLFQQWLSSDTTDIPIYINNRTAITQEERLLVTKMTPYAMKKEALLIVTRLVQGTYDRHCKDIQKFTGQVLLAKGVQYFLLFELLRMGISTATAFIWTKLSPKTSTDSESAARLSRRTLLLTKTNPTNGK